MVLEPQTVQSSSLPPWFITGVISYFSPTAKRSGHHTKMTSVRWKVFQEEDCDQSRYFEYFLAGGGGPVRRPDCHLSDVTGTRVSSGAKIIPSVSINHSGSISRLSQHSAHHIVSLSPSPAMQTGVAPGPQIIGGLGQNTWLVWTTASCLLHDSSYVCNL